MLERVTKESAERRAIGQKNREMKQPERPASRHRPRGGPLVELDQHAIVVRRTELGASGGPVERAKTDECLVVLDRSGEVRDLQPHAPDTRVIRQPEAVRPDAVWWNLSSGHL